jgi:hypothetical protein
MKTIKIAYLITSIVGLPFYISGQTLESDRTKSEDTTIVLNKEVAKMMLEEYKKDTEIKNDLVPDYSRQWMVTDRPHIAETPYMVPKKHLQAETGFQFQNSRTTFSKTNDLTYLTALIRLGLSRRFEARVEMEYSGTKTRLLNNDSLIVNSNGLSGLHLGSKVFLFNNKGIFPKGTLLYGVSLPILGSKNFRPSYTAAEIKFLFLNRIAHFYEFEYNVGIQWDGNTKNAAYAYALNNEFEITQKFHCFVELYGFFNENSGKDDRFNGSFINDHRANGGIWYLFNKGLQFDLSGGVGLSKISPEYYFAVGLSSRIGLSKGY